MVLYLSPLPMKSEKMVQKDKDLSVSVNIYFEKDEYYFLKISRVYWFNISIFLGSKIFFSNTKLLFSLLLDLKLLFYKHNPDL